MRAMAEPMHQLTTPTGNFQRLLNVAVLNVAVLNVAVLNVAAAGPI